MTSAFSVVEVKKTPTEPATGGCWAPAGTWTASLKEMVALLPGNLAWISCPARSAPELAFPLMVTTASLESRLSILLTALAVSVS